MLFERKAAWPPYHLVERGIEERAQEKLDKLERLYHLGQEHVWDGRQVLSDLIAKHGKPTLRPEHREPVTKILSILLWGELAAWAISADLAERIEDVEAKMAATSQAHDEARHFYVLRDYCHALEVPLPRLGGIARGLLTRLIETESLVEKLVGMQLLVESNALAIFRGLADADVEPVLTELLPYYERDESRHVGLGVMYLPRFLKDLNRLDTARLLAFQVRCIGFLMTGGMTLREDFGAIGIDQRKLASYTVKLQGDIVRDMLTAARPGAGGRRRDSVRGLMNPAKGVGQAIIDFVHPVAGVESARGLHRAVIKTWTRAGKLADRVFA
jgi:hypothetical protein